MYKFFRDRIRVFANDAEIYFASIDTHDNVPTLQYSLKSSPCRIRVELASDNRHLQVVFQCGTRRMCVVNARDKRQALVFDGFPDTEDEGRTTTFAVGTLKELRDNHGLRVREMARVMESPTILELFINEAIISTCATIYNNLANSDCENDDEDDDTAELKDLLLRLDKHKDLILLSSRTKSVNGTHWAPVSCKTGRFLLTVNLKFTFISSTNNN